MEQSERLANRGFDIAMKRVDVCAEQPAHHNRAVRFERLGSALNIDISGLKIQIA